MSEPQRPYHADDFLGSAWVSADNPQEALCHSCLALGAWERKAGSAPLCPTCAARPSAVINARLSVQHPSPKEDTMPAKTQDKTATKTKAPKAEKPTKEEGVVSFRGQSFTLTAGEATKKLQAALKEDDSKAKAGPAYGVIVDGRPISVRWAVTKITGISAKEFNSVMAVAFLRRLGLTVENFAPVTKEPKAEANGSGEAHPVPKPTAKRSRKAEAETPAALA